jgi:hypothetical protein
MGLADNIKMGTVVFKPPTKGGEIFVFTADGETDSNGMADLVSFSTADLEALRVVIGPLLLAVENHMDTRGCFMRYTTNEGPR